MPNTRQGGKQDLPRLLTGRQFAHLINRHPHWVRMARNMGRIPAAQKVGPLWVYPEDALIRPAHVTLDNRLLDIGIPDSFLGGEVWYGPEPEYPDHTGRGKLGGGPRASHCPNLANLREERGMTQYALAKKSGVHHTTIAKVERGARAAPRTIVRLAEGLEIDYGELLREVR
jgi:DNA-binding XRE family transcriptional regulator